MIATTGCYIGQNWGQNAEARLIQIAAEFGWDNKEALVAAEEYLENTDKEQRRSTIDIVFEASYDAEDWLNKEIAPDGCLFGWYNTEFYLMPNSWWEAKE